MIVAISQWLIYMVYLFPLSSITGFVELFDNLWLLFIIDTVLIAAGGYIVNDLMDQKADTFNKPTRIFIGPGKIEPFNGWVYYALIVVAGFFLAYYIAYKIGKLPLLSIYLIAVALLFMYSYYFKRLPLIGNFVVSIFCAFVPGIIWYAEFDLISSTELLHNNLYGLITHYFPAYISFAFLSTFLREIVKDIEDREGDLRSNYKTLPVLVGVDRTNVVALFFGFLLLCSYGLWFYGNTRTEDLIMGFVIVIGLILPTAYILRSIYYAKTTQDYTAISKLLKYLMIVSLFIFLCIPFVLK